MKQIEIKPIAKITIISNKVMDYYFLLFINLEPIPKFDRIKNDNYMNILFYDQV